MKAIIIDRPGGPANLQLREKPDLQPAPGMLTIDVAYAGVGYFEVLLSRGEFISAFSDAAYSRIGSIGICTCHRGRS